MVSLTSEKNLRVRLRPAPFARAGLHIEGEERVPGVLVMSLPVSQWMVMPAAVASRRSRLIALRWREFSVARKSSKVAKPWLCQWNCWSVRCRKPWLARNSPIGFAGERHMRDEALLMPQSAVSPEASALPTCSRSTPSRINSAAGRRREGTEACSFG